MSDSKAAKFLAEVKARSDAATGSRKWVCRHNEMDVTVHDGDALGREIAAVWAGGIADDEQDATGEFIAHARDDVPRLRRIAMKRGDALEDVLAQIRTMDGERDLYLVAVRTAEAALSYDGTE